MTFSPEIERIKRNIASVIPNLKSHLLEGGAESAENAFSIIVSCLRIWPPAKKYLQMEFIESLYSLAAGMRLHIQYIFTSQGEFLMGGTHESIQKYNRGGTCLHAGNISFKGIESGKMIFYIDQGSSSTGKKLGRRAPAPLELTQKINLYIPKELREFVEFIALPGTDALLWKR